MNWLKKALKSKTMNFNIILGGAFAVAKGFGYEVDADTATAVLTLGNVLLRTLTTKAIGDK